MTPPCVTSKVKTLYKIATISVILRIEFYEQNKKSYKVTFVALINNYCEKF